MDLPRDAVIQKFLQNYALPAIKPLVQSFKQTLRQNKIHYSDCVCLPAFAEKDIYSVFQAITSTKNEAKKNESKNKQPWLGVILINHPEGARKEEHLINQHLFRQLQSHAKGRLIHEDQWAQALLIENANEHFLSIHWLKALPKQQGVGLARRLLADLVIDLWSDGFIQRDYFGMTDADALLPSDYFQQIQSLEQTLNDSGKRHGIALFQSDYQYPRQAYNQETQNQAADALLKAHHYYQLMYEAYRSALAQAMPEYGFTALGSVLAIEFQAYAHVRGFPLRSAAEDFYLMNKIIKYSSGFQLQGEPIILQPRISRRTPFGTGQRVNQLLKDDALEDQPLFYEKAILKHWTQTLQTIRHLCLSGQASELSAFLIAFNRNSGPLAAQKNQANLGLLKWQEKMLNQMQQCTSKHQLLQLLKNQMDGLRCQQILSGLHQCKPLKTPRQHFQTSENFEPPNRVSLIKPLPQLQNQ